MSTDVELWEASCRGEREAFELLVERYEEAVCGITYALTGDRSLSEDLAQETFLTAWRKVRDLREPEKAAAWLCGIARNLGRRARSRRPVVELKTDRPSAEPSPDEALADRQEQELVWRTLSELPPRYREPLVLYYREGRSTQRVAELLELTTAAAQQRLSRGRKLLRRELESVVETTLESTRARGDVRRRVAAALPLAAPRPSEAGTSIATIGLGVISMKYAAGIIATIAIAIVLFLFTREDTEAPGKDDAAAVVAKSDSKASRTERGSEVPPTSAQRRAAAQADCEAARHKPSAPLEVTRNGSRVTVNLDGGPSQLSSHYSGDTFLTFDPKSIEPELLEIISVKPRRDGPTRRVRGLVRDRDGRPVAGAIVMAGRYVGFVSGTETEKHAAADEAAATAQDGSFELAMLADSPFNAVAVYVDGFSEVEHVEPGTSAVELELRIEGAARLRGTVRRAGEGVVARVEAVSVGSDGVSFSAESDLDGFYDLDPIPPGDYKVVAAISRTVSMRGHVEEEVPVPAGRTATLDLDLPAGTLVAVSITLKTELSGPTVLTYVLLPGHHTFASRDEAEPLYSEDSASMSSVSLTPELLVEEPIEIPAVDPGEWTACVEVRAAAEDPTAVFGCRQLTVAKGQDVAEVELTL